MLCSLATNVDSNIMKTITDLEKDLGKTLLAFKCHNLNPSMLNMDQVNKIQEVEAKLGVSLVAVDS
jgi:hypothetical protein